MPGYLELAEVDRLYRLGMWCHLDFVASGTSLGDESVGLLFLVLKL